MQEDNQEYSIQEAVVLSMKRQRKIEAKEKRDRDEGMAAIARLLGPEKTR